MVKTKSRAKNARAATAKPRKGGQPSKQPRGRSSRRNDDKNEYLETLLNPEICTTVKIPDTTVAESATLQTRGVIDITLDGSGNCLYAIAPAYDPGGGVFNANAAAALRIGMDNLGNLTMMDQASATLPPGYNGCIKTDVMSTKLSNEIRSTFSSIRPVSFCMKVTCTEAALSAHGTHFAGCWDRGQYPAQAIPAGYAPADFSNYFGNNTNGPETLDEAASGAVQLTNLTSNLCVNWAPQDESDFVYRNTNYGTHASAAFFNTDYGAGAMYWTPFQVTANLRPANVVAGVVEINAEASLPYLIYGVRGGTPNASAITLELFINWEAIPIATESKIVAGSPSPSNPGELAQATNVMTLLPAVRQPDVPGDVTTRMYESAAKSSSHLYDGSTSKKKATEGTSWIDDIVGFVSNNWSSIASVGSALLALL